MNARTIFLLSVGFAVASYVNQNNGDGNDDDYAYASCSKNPGWPERHCLDEIPFSKEDMEKQMGCHDYRGLALWMESMKKESR